MKRHSKAKDTPVQSQEFIRNFVQVPPMPRPIPAPRAKQEPEETAEAADGESGVLTKQK